MTGIFTVFSVFPTTGDNIFAKKLETPRGNQL
jgi:hypothetical protein